MAKTKAHPGFTLIEVMVVVVIAVLLAGLTIVAAGSFIRSSRSAAEQNTLRSMSIGVEQFEQRVGFAPPLVNDASPVNARAATEFTIRQLGETANQNANDEEERVQRYLAYETQPDELRMSQLSLPYYLLGVLGKEIDGVDGPGMTMPLISPQPSPWRSFSKTGTTIEPFFSPGDDKDRLAPSTPDGQPFTGADPVRQTRILDRWRSPVRYYRWEPLFHTNSGAVSPGRTGAPGNEPTRNNEVRDYNAPFVLGDPRRTENAALRVAKWAIISPGPDRQIDETNASSAVNADNIMVIDGGSAIQGGGS